jgi:hypothetical protein
MGHYQFTTEDRPRPQLIPLDQGTPSLRAKEILAELEYSRLEFEDIVDQINQSIQELSTRKDLLLRVLGSEATS